MDQGRSDKKLLLLTHRWPYPPDKGDRIRGFGLLRELSRHFSLDLLSICDAPPPPEHLSALRPMVHEFCPIPRPKFAHLWGLVRSFFTGRSATEDSFATPEFSRTLSNWLAQHKYSVVLAICSSAGAAMLECPGVLLITDFVDADSAKWAAYAAERPWPTRWVFQREHRRVARLEERLAQRSALIAAISPLELDLLAPSVDTPRLVVPNGVDTDYFCPPEKPMPRKNVIFFGQMDYAPNIQAVQWFAEHVWPALHRQNPRAEFRIVGRRPTTVVQALGRIASVRVVGEVPDVRPFLQDSLAVAPLQIARGVQNKVLEALACGAPVAASPLAVQGLDLAGWPVVRICQEPAQWVAALDDLLQHSEQADTLGRQGREFVLARYTWPSALAPLVNAIHALPTADGRTRKSP